MKRQLTISAVCGALLLSGCLGANTGDPRQGGLFGYSPKNYEQRIQDREARYEEVQEERPSCRKNRPPWKSRKIRSRPMWRHRKGI